MFELVEQNLKPLKQDTLFFHYENDYKRFSLAFDVQFRVGKTQINDAELLNYDSTVIKIDQAGFKLKEIIDKLQKQQWTGSSSNRVSYLLIIAGYASQLSDYDQNRDYNFSYSRAYHLWEHWKDIGIDFESMRYNGLIDLQISGNGWGGVGRYQRDDNNSFQNEKKNQRFIIQIIPKIGDIK